MKVLFGITALATVAFPLLVPAPAAAALPASADVTFVVPLNLTNLAGDITKVRVRCSIFSSNFVGGPSKDGWGADSNEIAVAAGQVVGSANVTIAVPAAALDLSLPTRSANYSCKLTGYSAAQGWQDFATGATGTVQGSNSFVLNPAPAPLIGSFQW